MDNQGSIIALTATYNAPSDVTYKDFWNVIVPNFALISMTNSVPLTSTEAINAIKSQFPNLSDYPSDSLPPKEIHTLQRETNGTYLLKYMEAVCHM